MYAKSKTLSLCALLCNHLDLFLAVMFWAAWGPSTTGILITQWAFLIYPLFLLPPFVQMFALPKLLRFVREQFWAVYRLELELRPPVQPLWNLFVLVFAYVGVFASSLHTFYVVVYVLAIIVDLTCLLILLASGLRWKKQAKQPAGEFEVFEGAAGAAEMFERMMRDAGESGAAGGFGVFGVGADFRSDFNSSQRTAGGFAGSINLDAMPIGVAVRINLDTGEMKVGVIDADGTVTDAEPSGSDPQIIDVEDFKVSDPEAQQSHATPLELGEGKAAEHETTSSDNPNP